MLLGINDTYRDEQNINTGAITRKVGVKVLNGTENWEYSVALLSYMYSLRIDDLYAESSNVTSGRKTPYCTHFERSEQWRMSDSTSRNNRIQAYQPGSGSAAIGLGYNYPSAAGLDDFKAWLADQYAAGTPVIVVYPLAESAQTTESVAAQTLTTAPVRQTTGSILSMPIEVVLGDGTREWVSEMITIATTRYNEESFAPVETRLDAAVAAVDTVVSQTMTQAQQIDQIANEKQTRPEEGCTAKYCLLVEDEDGTPHWYPIAGANGVAHALPAGYTELQYLQTDGNSWIDTGIVATNWNWSAQFEMSVPKAGDYFFGAGSGIWSSTVWGAQFGLANSSGHSFWGKGGTGMNAVISNLDVTTNTFYNYKITKDGLYINDVLKSNNLAGESFSNSDLSLWIGKTNNDKTTSSYNKSSSSWRYVKIYNDNNKLVFNGIPAKNSSGVVGMYDMVSGQFFTNAGTGTFTAGPDM
jgi:hypothetical protein